MKSSSNERVVRLGPTAVGVLVLLWLGVAIPLHAQSWTARHGLSPAQYQASFNELSSQGYRLQSVSGYASGGEIRYASLWTKASGPPWVAKHGLTPADYQKAFDDYAKQGFRLTYVNGYEVGDKDYYAAVWEKKSGPAWEARHGLSEPEYQAAFDSYAKQGYRPVFVTGYIHSGVVRYAAVLEKSGGPATVARHGLTATDYQKAFNELKQQGFPSVRSM